MAFDGHVIGWDDEIVNDGAEYIYLEEGDYDFTVKSYERGTFKGSAKIPQCPKLELKLEVATPNGNATVNYDLIMWSSLEWKLSEFLRAIGMKKHGDPIHIKWNQLTGARGRARFYTREYDKADGFKGKANDVRRMYDYEEPAWVAEAEGAQQMDFGGF